MIQKTIKMSLLNELLRKRDEALGFSGCTIKKRSSRLSCLLKFMNSHSLGLYSPEVGQNFLVEYCPSSTQNVCLQFKCLINILDEICGNTPPGTRRKRVEHKMYGCLAPTAEDYIRYLKEEQRLAKTTVRTHRYIISHFTQKLAMEDLTWDDLRYSHLVDFISSTKNSTPLVLGCIRKFLHYAYSHGCTKEDYSLHLLSVKPHRKESIPSYYTPKEVALVEKAIDRRSGIGKRDYAMVLLATRLGLRSSDIRLLEFKNMDWDNNEIRIIQYKTGRELVLPLLADVGEAIIDYVKNARPQSIQKQVFLTCSHPYKPCESSTVSSIVKRYFMLSGVDCKGKHAGPHALRHSLATAMLGEGTSLPIVSSVLGHGSSESTMYYLGVDVPSLLKCSLKVPPVAEGFYTQKGGILYE